jgi:hypothetical protein
MNDIGQIERKTQNSAIRPSTLPGTTEQSCGIS